MLPVYNTAAEGNLAVMFYIVLSRGNAATLHVGNWATETVVNKYSHRYDSPLASRSDHFRTGMGLIFISRILS